MLKPTHGDQVRRLDAHALLAERLRRALIDPDAEEVARLLKLFRERRRARRPPQAGREGDPRYNRRYEALNEAYRTSSASRPGSTRRSGSRAAHRPAADLDQPDRATLGGPARGAARAGAVSPRRRAAVRAPHAPRHHRPARPAARRLRAPRPDLQPARAAARGSCSCSGRRPTTASSSRTRRTSAGATAASADLIPLLGDGLLTIDGDFHRRSRRIMLPAFHRERIAAALGDDGRPRSSARSRRGGPATGRPVRVGAGAGAARRDAGAVRARPRPPGRRDRTRRASSSARSATTGATYWLQVLRGPRTPWAALTDARRRLDGLIFAEIARRRRSGERGEDLLSLLLDADRRGRRAARDRHVRDEVMTLLFAGHDTTTATVAFLFRELALQPDVAGGSPMSWRARGAPACRADGRRPAAARLALDETLRLYPPAWIGPRRAVRPSSSRASRCPTARP